MFRVSFVDREEHPHPKEIQEGYPAICVNGTVGGRLKFRKGYTYYFNVKANPKYPGVHFYLTTSSTGGPDDISEPVGGTVPITSGAFNLEVDDSLPCKFYYQLKEAANAGGSCVVEDCD